MATSAPKWAADIFLDINMPGASQPLYVRLKEAIKTAIRTGRLQNGSRLPASRVLAEEMRCSRAVIVSAYTQLVAEGFVETRQGSGTVVVGAIAPVTTPGAADRQPSFRYNFSPGVSDLSLFPRSHWHRAVQHVMTTVAAPELHYSDPTGSRSFRTAITERLARTRGVMTTPDNLHACAGTVQAVSLMGRLLADEGHTSIGVEDPSWPRIRSPLSSTGLNLVPLRVDNDGLVVAELERHPEVRAMLITPAHQFPTGVIMSPQRRTELIAWADQNDAIIIEDDYDAEFNFGPQACGAVQPLAPSRVVHLGTTSKILSPALRLGWMAVPEHLTKRLANIRPEFDLGVSTIDQLAMVHLVETGLLDHHLQTTRRRYRQRRDILADAVHRHLPNAQVTGAPAGLHLVVHLANDVDEDALVREADARSVRILSLRSFFLRPPATIKPGVVLGYASLTERDIQAGIELLGDALYAARVDVTR